MKTVISNRNIRTSQNTIGFKWSIKRRFK